MSSFRSYVLGPLVIGLGAVSPGIVLSADGEAATSYDLDEIVVTASRRAETALDAPHFINVRGMQELQTVRQVRTVPDAMRDLPGVMIQKTGHGQGSPFIRGFTGLRTLFMIDGIRLNNSTFREGPNQYWNTVDPLSAARLEVVKGPTSVLYGSDAIGGTVNAISRSYRDVTATGGVQWRMYARAATAEDSIVFRPEVGYAGDRFELMAAMSFKDFGNLEGGDEIGTQPKTGYDEKDAEVKLSVDVAERAYLTFAYQQVDQDDAWRSHKTIFGKSWKGTTVGNELKRSLSQDRKLGYVQYRADDVSNRISELVLSASFHQQEEERTRIRSDGRTDIQGVGVGTSGVFGHVVIPSGIGTLTTGIEYYRDDVDSYRSDYNADGTLRSVRIQGPVADDATYGTLAAFIQDQVELGARTNVTLGMRYTRAEADAKSVQDPVTGERIRIEDDWNATTLSARLSHRLRDDSVVFGGVSQGFRAPNLSDLTRLDSARSNEIETPVPGLDAENFLTYELGVKLARDRWTTQAAVYYTDIDDMIVRTPTGNVIDGDNEVTKRNSGGGFVKGLEVQARFQVNDAWSVFGDTTWLDGEVDTYPTSAPVIVREPIDRLMPFTINAGLHWAPPDADWWFEGQVSHADKQDELSTRDRSDTDRIPVGGTPGYTVVTLRGGWQVTEQFSLSAALENVLDEDYRVHGSGVNEPGRNLVVTLLWMP